MNLRTQDLCGLGLAFSSLAFGQSTTTAPFPDKPRDSDTTLQMVGCTESQRECAQLCSDHIASNSVFSPETCFDWFRTGRYICFCRIPSPY